MLNTTYALLIERADAKDRAELLLSPDVEPKERDSLARHREELDAWLLSPMGVQAVAEKELLAELGVGAA